MSDRGIAPDAKVAFTDLGSAGGDGISTPEDLATRYYNHAYDVGARVHSDSWGSGSTSYDYMAAQVDLFTWQNQVETPSHIYPDSCMSCLKFRQENSNPCACKTLHFDSNLQLKISSCSLDAFIVWILTLVSCRTLQQYLPLAMKGL